MNKSLFTAEQIQDLKREFVEFKLNEMSHEDMYAWIRDVYMYCLLYTSPSPRD